MIMSIKIKFVFAVALVALGTVAGAQSTATKKELVAKVAGVPAKEIWKDVSHTVWDSN